MEKSRKTHIAADITECELFKIIKNRWAVILFFVPSALIICAFGYMRYKYPGLTAGGTLEYPNNPVNTIVYYIYGVSEYAFPFVIALFCAQLFIIEKQDDGFRLFKTLPCSTGKTILIKYAITTAGVILSVATAYAVYLVCARLSGIFMPLMAINDYRMESAVAVFFLRMAFAAFCIAIIQYGLHLITRSYYFPVVFAFAAMFIQILPEEIDYYLYVGYLRSALFNLQSYGAIRLDYMMIMLIPPALVTAVYLLLNKLR
ncbi:MAG: ABC transporter permease [Bacteroidales bacterium]|jgi:ABC-type transport system involved in multi-copper enzyme maturation permease subunit|nr:ABC transporter permease [Bacteroidales bacterium]